MEQREQSASHGAVVHHAPSIITELAEVLALEAAAISKLVENLPLEASLLVEKIIATTGKVIFSGIGKSGLVAQKLAATFSSLGTPSCFLHPTDALHGDLGMVQHDDLFIALSKSGNSFEFDQIFPVLKNTKNEIVLICCKPGILSQKSDLTVVLPCSTEACALNLAPTSSSTLMMAFGDAVAVVTSKLRNFNRQDFARVHPAGVLGKKLILTAQDLMHHTEEALPLMYPDTSFQNLLFTISSKKLGVGIVIDAERRLQGVITDGDLRRACNKGPMVFELNAQEIMTANPKQIQPQMLAVDALAYMETYKITSLVVTEQNKVRGLLHIHDIIKTGIQG